MKTKKLVTSTEFLLLFTIFLWGSAFVAIRIGLQGYSPGPLVLLRYAIASITMVFIYLRLPNRHAVNFTNFLKITLVGMLGITVYNLALNYAELNLTGGIASFVVSQSPIFSALLCWLILKEKLSLMTWLGFIISFVGILMIAISETEGIKFNIYLIFALISAMAGALYSVLQKPLLKHYSAMEFITIAIWGATLGLLVFTHPLLKEIPHAPWHATLAAIYLGVFPGAIGYALWSVALVKMPASRVVSYLYLMPIFATLIGLSIGEIPPLLSVIGGLIALFGAIVVNKSK